MLISFFKMIVNLVIGLEDCESKGGFTHLLKDEFKFDFFRFLFLNFREHNIDIYLTTGIVLLLKIRFIYFQNSAHKCTQILRYLNECSLYEYIRIYKDKKIITVLKFYSLIT